MPRLLLVEDEQVNRDLFRRRLERKGYAVVTAEDGLGAVALTKGEKPDLVIMDLGLPDIDGWEATRRIKADAATADIPVVVLSAHATTEAREKAFAAGCEEFETKPVNWEALFKKIEDALAKAAEKAKAKTAAAAAPPAREDEIDLGGSPAGPDPGALTDVIRKPRAPGAPDASTVLLPPAALVGKRPAAPAKLPSTAPAGTSCSVARGGQDDDEKEVCAVQPKRILVVEDNDANRVMLCRRLNKHGYATTEAADGRQALDAVLRQRFDLVLCDIMMPGVDGYEVLREMKSDPDLQPIPVIMISAVDEMASVVRCIEMGAEDYLQKPYDPVLLHARINACLDKRRLRDQEIAYLRAVKELTEAAALVERGRFDPAPLAPIAARDDALGTLARVFAKMAREVQAREEQLRSDVKRLVAVEIDAKELTREVSRVTESDAFDKARKHAEEARARRQRGAPPS
jgi:two-component system, cell cycle response regulator